MFPSFPHRPPPSTAKQAANRPLHPRPAPAANQHRGDDRPNSVQTNCPTCRPHPRPTPQYSSPKSYPLEPGISKGSGPSKVSEQILPPYPPNCCQPHSIILLACCVCLYKHGLDMVLQQNTKRCLPPVVAKCCSAWKSEFLRKKWPKHARCVSTD